MKHLDVFLIFLVVRLASVFLVQTFYVPDEYWQSLEVAHNFVYGYGYLTWEWALGIRSYIHPLVIAGLYKVLELAGLDCALSLIYGPKVLQALLSAYSDVCFYKWSGTKKWAVFSVVSSWFYFYTGSRTIINSFECALSTIALSKFPWPGKGIEDNTKFIWIVALLFVIRPTCAIIWLPICFYHFVVTKKRVLKLFLTSYVPIGLCTLGLSVLIDSLAYGKLTFTVFNFLKLNVFQNVGTWYGSQPWHWYLSCGIPAILGIQLLPFAMATAVVLKNRRNHPNELALLGTNVFAVIVYSCLPHKEFRFLLPLLPILLYISSRFLSAWSKKASMFSIWLVTLIIFLANVVPAWYFSFVHQRGTLDVMGTLRDISYRDPAKTSILFLMPCHSTPLYSHLHVNVTTRFLTCLPNFNNDPNYLDEADYFYSGPNKWLRQNYPPNGTLPSHIVTFDVLVPAINDILSRYKQMQHFFHCSIPVSSRIGRYVVLHELKPL